MDFNNNTFEEKYQICITNLETIQKLINSKALDVLIYIIKNMDKEKKAFFGTYNQITKEVEVSMTTISSLMRTWQDCGLTEKIQTATWAINIDVIMDALNVRNLCNDNNKTDSIVVADDKPLRKALVSGSYDPFTYAHLSLVKQASKMFDEVHVVIFVNSAKKRTYESGDMVEAIKRTLEKEGITNCVVGKDNGLLAKYCQENGITTNVRGLRNNLDYNYEENIAEVNNLINPELCTIYLRGNGSKLSSSTVRELLKYGEDVSKYVPEEILKIIL